MAPASVIVLVLHAIPLDIRAAALMLLTLTHLVALAAFAAVAMALGGTLTPRVRIAGAGSGFRRCLAAAGRGHPLRRFGGGSFAITSVSAGDPGGRQHALVPHLPLLCCLSCVVCRFST